METAYSEILLQDIAELLGHIYVAQLFCIGAIGAVLVCFILYKFLKAFY